MDWHKVAERLPMLPKGRRNSNQLLLCDTNGFIRVGEMCTDYNNDRYYWIAYGTRKTKYYEVEPPEFWCYIEKPLGGKNEIK